MDRRVTVWDLADVDGAPLFEKTFDKPIGAVALGDDGLVVGLFAPGKVAWYRDVAAATPSFELEMGGDVAGAALNETDGEVAVCYGNHVVVYSLASGEKLAKFRTFGGVEAVATARVLTHRVIIEGQGGLELQLRNELRIVGESTGKRTPKDVKRRTNGLTPRKLHTQESAFFESPGGPKPTFRDRASSHAARWLAPPDRPELREESVIRGCVMRISRVEATFFSEILLKTLDGPWANLFGGALVVASVVVLVRHAPRRRRRRADGPRLRLPRRRQRLPRGALGREARRQGLVRRRGAQGREVRRRGGLRGRGGRLRGRGRRPGLARQRRGPLGLRVRVRVPLHLLPHLVRAGLQELGLPREHHDPDLLRDPLLHVHRRLRRGRVHVRAHGHLAEEGPGHVADDLALPVHVGQRRGAAPPERFSGRATVFP